MIPVYFRTLAEVPALQTDGSSAWGVHHRSGRVAGGADAIRGGVSTHGDVVSPGVGVHGFVRAFTEPAARAALVEPEGDAGVVDALYTRISPAPRGRAGAISFGTCSGGVP